MKKGAEDKAMRAERKRMRRRACRGCRVAFAFALICLMRLVQKDDKKK
jgi:hypothetical protein